MKLPAFRLLLPTAFSCTLLCMLTQASAQVSAYSTSTVPQNAASNTQVLSALAGALTANAVARKSNNSAAISATQGNLINTEANLVSSHVTQVLNVLVSTHS